MRWSLRGSGKNLAQGQSVAANRFFSVCGLSGQRRWQSIAPKSALVGLDMQALELAFFETIAAIAFTLKRPCHMIGGLPFSSSHQNLTEVIFLSARPEYPA